MPEPAAQLAAITAKHGREACHAADRVDITNPDLPRANLVGLIVNLAGNLAALVRQSEAQQDVETQLRTQLEELRAENERLATAVNDHTPARPTRSTVMTNTARILDLADTLAAEGTLDLEQPQTAEQMRAAARFAVEAIRQAYRVAYKHTAGDLDNDMVDALDAAEITIRDAIDELPA